MEISNLTAISPVDGRYGNKVTAMRSLFSEFALMRYRLLIEIKWLKILADENSIEAIPPLSQHSQAFLEGLFDKFSLEDAEIIKGIELASNHDVKAIEYFIQRKIDQHDDLKHLKSFVHFACTSEDINNLAYACMLKQARQTVLLPQMDLVIEKIAQLSQWYSAVPMLARTHGQAATPTTFGKEMAIFTARLLKQRQNFADTAILGKINGASGNYNAHLIAYPNTDWQALSRRHVEGLGLEWNPYSTQIEPHDYVAELMNSQQQFNTILIDFSRDIWSYVSLHYLKQKAIEGEVGSSTMPHKINPIDFENAEGNLGIANALLAHFATKLPISRLQRDLSDSTVFRNIGMGFSHSFIAYQNLVSGIAKLEVNQEKMYHDLNKNWEVLAEAVQTVMRKHGIADAYEQLKAMTRGKHLSAEDYRDFIKGLNIADDDKARLSALSPDLYIGLSVEIAKSI